MTGCSASTRRAALLTMCALAGATLPRELTAQLRQAGATARPRGELPAAGLVATGTASGVALRWGWDPGASGAPPATVLVERRAGTGEWARLTTSPIVPVRDRGAARALLGEAYARYEPLLFPADPLAALREIETRRSMLLLAADVNPALARVLGLRYDDTTARAGERYEYRIVALAGGHEAVAATSRAVLAGRYVQAAAPESLTAVQTRIAVELAWRPRPEFSAYNVYRAMDGGALARINDAPVVVFTAAAGVDAESSPSLFRDSGLASIPAGATLHYAVEGIDPFGRTSARSAATTLVTRDLAPPDPPPTTRATVHGDTVVVAWEPSPDSDVVAYQVWRSAESRGGFAAIGTRLSAETHQLRDAGRPARALSWYRVTAIDRAGNESAPSFLAVAEVPDLVPPPPPDSLRGDSASGRLTLRWRAVAAPDLRGYRVYRAARRGVELALITPTPIAATALVDSIPVGADHEYYYRVTAVDSAFNESAPSATLRLRPPDLQAPSPPLVTTVAPGEDRLTVTWTPNPEPDVVAYRVSWRRVGGGTWTSVPDSLGRAATHAVILAVPPRTPIEVTVAAVDDAGNQSLPSPPLVSEAYHRAPPSAIEIDRAEYDARRGGVVVTWRRTTAGRVVVLRREVRDSAMVTVGGAEADAGLFVDRTVRPRASYEYTLRTVDRFGNSADGRRTRHTDVGGGR